MSRFWNNNTKNITPYVPGEQPKDRSLIKLNTNESPYPPSPLVIKRIKNINLANLKLYPNPEGEPVKKAASAYYNIPEDRIFAGNGSDEVLGLLFKAFFDSTTKIAFPDITYSFYPVYSALFEIPHIKVPVKEDFTIDLNSYPEDVKGIIFANPNAPTGLYITLDEIEKLLADRPDTLVVIDEAYVDFAEKSAVDLISKYDNLLVVQTLSKSRALAGMRIGLAFGNEELIEGLNRVKNSFNSYPLNTISQVAGQAAFEDEDYFNSVINQIVRTREWIISRLKEMGLKVTDSKSNFIFVSIPGISGPDLLERLRQEGILVRNFKDPRIIDWVRITIGTEDNMKNVVNTIKKIIGQ